MKKNNKGGKIMWILRLLKLEDIMLLFHYLIQYVSVRSDKKYNYFSGLFEI